MSPSQVFCGEPVRGTGRGLLGGVEGSLQEEAPLWLFNLFKTVGIKEPHHTHGTQKKRDSRHQARHSTLCPKGQPLQTCSRPVLRAGALQHLPWAGLALGPEHCLPLWTFPIGEVRQAKDKDFTQHKIKEQPVLSNGFGVGRSGDSQHCHAAIYRILGMHLD